MTTNTFNDYRLAWAMAKIWAHAHPFFAGLFVGHYLALIAVLLIVL